MSARRVYSDAYGETTEGLRRALKGCKTDAQRKACVQ